MFPFNKTNFLYNAGVVMFMACVALVLVAARRAMPGASAAPADDDSRFAMKAVSGGMAEVQLGQLAAEKGSIPAVKQFGQRMVVDHSNANEELKSAASQSNVKLPSAMGKEEADIYTQLSKLSGQAFDQAYAKEVVKNHEQDIIEFQKESSSGKSEVFKDFASKALPTLQSDLQKAREMQKTVMSTSTGM